ncbi:MAG: DDE-type integrase/transposase/recombinase [Tepidisphaeraceae bacterium]|jgi:IS1 family transposase
MAYVLPEQKQRAIIHLLVEGNSIRSIERLTGVHRDTIMRLAVKVGDKCQKFLNAWMRNLKLRHIQADEIWTFVGCKQGNLKRALVITEGMGDQYLYVAFDQDTKLIATYAIGRRSKEVTQAFMYDLADRLVTEHPQLSTDGFNAYPNAVKNAFGDEIAYGQIIKEFAEPIQPGRYGPPVMVAVERRQITGLADINLNSICTSHVERNNLTIRTFIKRFTRLSLGFSKKLENLAAAVALHVAHYNFCRVHSTTRVTPAMAAGVTDHVWELEELLAAI